MFISVLIVSLDQDIKTKSHPIYWKKKHRKVHTSSKPIIEEEIYGKHCSCRKIFYDEEDLEKHRKELILNVVCVARV